MPRQPSEQSYTIPGANPGTRTRIFLDGKQPDEEWQCADCQTWYSSFEMRQLNVRRKSCSCLHCHPPAEGSYVDRLWRGQAYLLSWNTTSGRADK